MAIAHDATTLAAANYTATGTQNTTHTAGANARAAVVLISQNGSTADQVSGVTYNGVAMNKVTLTNWTDTTEAGAVYIYWLDGITGQGSAVTVSMATTGTASKRLAVSTMTTDNGKAVVIGGSDSTTSASGTNPTTTITGLSSGTTYYSYLVLHSGLQTMTTTPGTGWTSIYNEDLGSQGRGMARRTAVDTGITSLACTWTAGTADDYVIAGIAFYENPVVTGTVISPSAQNPAISPTTAAAGPTSQTKLALVPGLVTRTNLFTNPRFQTAATNVSAYNYNVTVAWNSTETRTATGGSVQASNQAVGWHAVYLGGVTVTAGRRYRVSLYCKQLAGFARPYAFYLFPTTWTAPMGYQGSQSSSTSWQRWSVESTASGTSIESLFFGAVGNNVDASESFVIDDILIEELPYGQTGVTGGYFDGVSDDNAYAREISQGWNGTADASTSYISYIDPAAPAVLLTPAASGARAGVSTAGPNNNLANNPDFEYDVDGWVGSGSSNATLSQTSAVAYTGTKAAMMTATVATGGIRMESTSLYVTANTTYTLSAYMRAAALTTTADVGMAFYDSTGTIIGALTYGTGVTTSTSAWTRATYTATAPANAVTVKLSVRPRNTATSTVGEVQYADAVLFQAASSAGTYYQATQPFIDPTSASAGDREAVATATNTTVAPTPGSSTSFTNHIATAATTITPTPGNAVPANMTKLGAATSTSPRTPAATAIEVLFSAATATSVTRTTNAVPQPIEDTASASLTISPSSLGNPAGVVKDIAGNDKTYGTITGGLGIDTAQQQGDATNVLVDTIEAAAGTAVKSQTAIGITLDPTEVAAGTASKSQTATGITLDPTEVATAVATKSQTAVNVTVTPAVAATPSALTKSTTAVGVTVDTTETATLGAATKSTATTGVTVAPSPLASAVITDTGNALNTLAGQTVTAVAGGTAKGGTAAVTITPTTAAAGVVADQGIANVTITPTSTATLGTVSKASTAAGVTVDTVEAASGIVTDTGVATSSVSQTSAAAGFVTDAATADDTVDLTTAAALSRTALATAPNITVAPASAATPGGTAKSSTVAVTVVPTTAAAAGAVTKSGTAGGVTVAPASTASAIVWKHEFLIPDALLSVTNLTGVVANIQDSPTAPDGTQLDPTTQTAIAVRMSFENPSQQLRATAGSQTIRVLVTDA